MRKESDIFPLFIKTTPFFQACSDTFVASKQQPTFTTPVRSFSIGRSVRSRPIKAGRVFHKNDVAVGEIAMARRTMVNSDESYSMEKWTTTQGAS